MPHRYTDVDRLILDRWQEVSGLREAFDDLLGRVKEVLEDSLGKVAATAQERGFSCDYSVKEPSIWFWKKEWETKTWKAPGVAILIRDFAPRAYGKVRDAHPWTYLDITEASKLKVKNRLQFAQTIRAGLDDELRKKWDVADADLEDYAVGVISRQIDDAERVRWIKEPADLQRFLLERLDEAREIVPAVDKALKAVGR